MTDAPPALRALAERYLAALLAGDRAAALRAVTDEGLARGVPVPDLQTQVIGAAQRAIGELWQQNRITVADEHAATAISQLALAQLYARLPRVRPRGRSVVIACVEGERHDMPARIATDHFEMAGFDAQFLGADVPAEALARAVAARAPDLLALSIALASHAPALRRTVAAVRAAAGAGLPVLVAGHALGEPDGLDAWPNVHVLRGTLDETVTYACRLF